VTLDEVGRENGRKLRTRYPEGPRAVPAPVIPEWVPCADCGEVHGYRRSSFDANGSPVDAVLPCPICDCAPCQCEALGYRPGFD
jgi:hypothetical protein